MRRRYNYKRDLIISVEKMNKHIVKALSDYKFDFEKTMDMELLMDMKLMFIIVHLMLDRFFIFQHI